MERKYMSDNYQAVFDAVRSKFSHFDGGGIEDAIARNFQFHHNMQNIEFAFSEAAEAMVSPSVLYKPALSIDGNQWCALYGANLQDGVAGFGDSPALAMLDFDKSWNANL
jgi:hypothetical protein